MPTGAGTVRNSTRQCSYFPKWILPYVKGPADKPLKAPTKTVYAVVR